MVTKTGTSGNDTLYGGAGGDQLIGLAGDDSYGVYSQLDSVVEQPGEGNDRVLTFASYALAAGASMETLSTAINAGTDAIQLTGNELNQIIVGNNGANTIDGRGGGDPMIGLGGDDVYYVSDRTDIVIEAANGGNDTVYVRGDFVLNAASSVETIAVAPSARNTGLSIGGNELAQAIIGGNGADTLNSGGGADTLSGGLGDDTYRLFGGETVIEAIGGGNDRVFTSGSFALAAQSEIEFLSTAVNAGTEATNLTGNLTAQTIVGNYGNNLIDGQGGRDTLIGLRGDDVYRVYGNAEVVLENAGEGNDTIFTSGSYVLASGSSVETLSTASNGGQNLINLTGNEFAQTIIGDFGQNSLDGGAGSDTLIGLQGNDVFLFTTAIGAGNIDTLADFGNGADRIRLDVNRFAGLTVGTLASSAIAIGAAAADADDRIVYNPTTGALSFDADGTGSTAAIQFAVLPTGLAAAQLSIEVANITNPSGAVRITAGGSYLIGGATGDGVALASAYPNATSFVFGDDTLPQGYSQPANLVFGPGSVAALAQRPVSFNDAYAVGSFDFSQLGTGVVLTPTSDFKTAGGDTIIAYPAIAGRLSQGPTSIIGSAQNDYIDASLHSGETQSPGTLRFGPSVYGGEGNDTLIGGNRMFGGNGDDLLISPLNATLVGGAGADTFRIGLNTRYLGQQTAPNTLVDYDPQVDKLELILSSAVSGFNAGVLPDTQFALGRPSGSGQAQIFYDPNTGNLNYYADGAERAIAFLPAHLDLTAANITLVGA